MTPLILIISLVILIVLALACYCMGYADAKAGRKKKRAIPQHDWRYELDAMWNDYVPKKNRARALNPDAVTQLKELI